MIQIANDGNLLPSPVVQTISDEQGIAERYDWVIDFSRYNIGDKVWMVNVCEHVDGKKPAADLSLAQALRPIERSLRGQVPGIPHRAGSETPDQSQVPSVLIPNPDLSSIPVSRTRTFNFGSGASQPLPDTEATYTTGAGGQKGPWGV